MTDINERGGQLPATPSGNSPGWLQKTKMQLTRTCSAGDIVRQFARLTAAYGDSRVATAEQRALLYILCPPRFGGMMFCQTTCWKDYSG